LYETDFYYQFRFDQGRTQWKLVYGEDVIATLPPVPKDRVTGGYYMDIRNWWDTFTRSALGDGPTSRDLIFRNSIAYKAAAEILNKWSALETGVTEHSRTKGIERALARASDPERNYLSRLQRTLENRYLSYEGDILEDTFQFLLRRLECFHLKLAQAPGFRPSLPMQIDAVPDELLLTAAARTRAAEVVEHVSNEWRGYRGAFLVPSVSFFNLDDFMLLIDVDPAKLPSLKQLRTLCRIHAERSRQLPQRVALLLLLDQGAYQLETVSLLELWHLVICPSANPDVFSLMECPDFVLDGEPRPDGTRLTWTSFASALVAEEIGVRSAAMSSVNTDPSMSSLELLRNVWRHLQLEIIQRSAQQGHVLVPMTPAAMRRAFRSWGVPGGEALRALEEAYRSELEGVSLDVRPLLNDFMAVVSHLQ
ncbi:MAG: hypothetical protein JO211_04160, partial [Acidobacteriaceae bacterium]|nr:hypothetical protein [Acidobacteriaceae bacterium]